MPTKQLFLLTESIAVLMLNSCSLGEKKPPKKPNQTPNTKPPWRRLINQWSSSQKYGVFPQEPHGPFHLFSQQLPCTSTELLKILRVEIFQKRTLYYTLTNQLQHIKASAQLFFFLSPVSRLNYLCAIENVIHLHNETNTSASFNHTGIQGMDLSCQW